MSDISERNPGWAPLSEILERAKPVRLGKTQFAMLDRICRTNGGGVSGYSLNRRVMERLYELDLIQGKRGQEWCAVHTSEGLALWRKITAEREAASKARSEPGEVTK